jgi:molecular chaperone DnaK (HSP70)
MVEATNKKTMPIGIDLGTTNSCVGVWRDGKIEIVPNQEGHPLTPSYISFGIEAREIGVKSKEKASQNPKNTIYSTKRFVGKLFNDPSL